MRTILVILAILLLLIQVRLWQEVREVRALRVMVGEQFEDNARLHERNEALAAEVEDLRAGLQAIEERARSELGLIQEGEAFYLIVDPDQVQPR